MMTMYPIVGAFFRPPAKAVLQVLPGNCPLMLVPEPNNPHDPNAIKVTVLTSDIPTSEFDTLEQLVAGHGLELQEVLDLETIHLGYLPREVAADVAPLLLGPTPGHLSWDLKGNPAVVIEG